MSVPRVSQGIQASWFNPKFTGYAFLGCCAVVASFEWLMPLPMNLLVGASCCPKGVGIPISKQNRPFGTSIFIK